MLVLFVTERWPETMKIKTVYFFRNGNTAVFDERGQQIPELQKSWLLLWTKHAKELGYDVLSVDKMLLPDGSNAKLFETMDGDLNWDVQ